MVCFADCTASLQPQGISLKAVCVAILKACCTTLVMTAMRPMVVAHLATCQTAHIRPVIHLHKMWHSGSSARCGSSEPLVASLALVNQADRIGSHCGQVSTKTTAPQQGQKAVMSANASQRPLVVLCISECLRLWLSEFSSHRMPAPNCCN